MMAGFHDPGSNDGLNVFSWRIGEDGWAHDLEFGALHGIDLYPGLGPLAPLISAYIDIQLIKATEA
jgi:hypothetical protein